MNTKSDIFQTEQDTKSIHIPTYTEDVHEPVDENFSVRIKSSRVPKKSSTPKSFYSNRISTARQSRRYANNPYAPRKSNPTSDLLIHEKSSEIELNSAKILLNEPITETDPQILSLVIVDLQNRRNRLEERGLFNESLHVQECIERTREARLEAAKLEMQKYAQLDIDIRKGHSKTDETIFKHKCDASTAQINVRFDKLRRSLLERQENEMNEHERLWHSEAKNRIYMHISQKLSTLRDMQNKLVSAKRYEEAAAIGNEADILEKQEEKKMCERRNADYVKSVEAMRKKHNDELESLERTREAKLSFLKISTENGKNIFRNRKRALKYNEDIANDKEKLWKLKHRNDPSISKIISNDPNIRKNTKGSLYNVSPKAQQLKLPPLSLRVSDV